VTVTRETLTVLERLSSATGVSKTELIGRLASWFESQRREVQSAITHSQGDAASEIAKLKLAEMAAAGTGDVSGMSIGDAIRAAKVLLDRIETVSSAYQEQLGVKGPGKKK